MVVWAKKVAVQVNKNGESLDRSESKASGISRQFEHGGKWRIMPK